MTWQPAQLGQAIGTVRERLFSGHSHARRCDRERAMLREGFYVNKIAGDVSLSSASRRSVGETIGRDLLNVAGLNTPSLKARTERHNAARPGSLIDVLLHVEHPAFKWRCRRTGSRTVGGHSIRTLPTATSDSYG